MSRAIQVHCNRVLILKTEKEAMEVCTQGSRNCIHGETNLYFVSFSSGSLLPFNIQIQTPLETNYFCVKNCFCTLKEEFVNANDSPEYVCLCVYVFTCMCVCVYVEGWYFKALEKGGGQERLRKKSPNKDSYLLYILLDHFLTGRGWSIRLVLQIFTYQEHKECLSNRIREKFKN